MKDIQDLLQKADIELTPWQQRILEIISKGGTLHMTPTGRMMWVLQDDAALSRLPD